MRSIRLKPLGLSDKVVSALCLPITKVAVGDGLLTRLIVQCG